MPRLVILLLLLLAPIEYTLSTPINNPVLPSQLQACVDSSGCVVGSSPEAVIGQMEAYTFFDLRQGSATSGYALRYSLLPPSAGNSNSGSAAIVVTSG